MAKVEIKYKRGGKIKSMDERYAKALVGAKMAEYVTESDATKQTYKTRELKAETVKPEPKKRGPKPKVKPEEIEPAKEQTYSTKDMSAED